jgi:hypothetical protein
MSAATHRRCGAAFLLLALAALPVAAARAAENPYRQQLARRTTELLQRGRTPGGVLPLLGLASFWERVEPEEVERVIALALRGANHPLVRGQGLLLAARAARRGGKTALARSRRAEAGVLEQWLLCGPFDSPSRRGHVEVFPPERELHAWPDLTRSYPGKGQQVRWRSISAFLVDGELPLGAFVSPARNVSVYLQTMLISETEQPAAQRLGSGGAFKVFLNGKQVGGREVFRVARPDQEAVGLWLQRGVNRLVIKQTVEEGRLHLFARLTRPDGSPVKGVKSQEHPPPGATLLGPSRRTAPAPASLTAWLAGQRARAGRPAVALLRDRAVLHARLGPEDSSERAAERAAELWAEAAGSAESLVALARVRSDRNRQREALEKALSLEADNPWALHQLAGLRHADGRILEAVQLWRRLLRTRPGFLPARLQLVEVLRSSGFEELAWQELEELAGSHPRVPLVLRAAAHQARARHALGRAEQLFRRLLQADQEDLAARQALVEIALDRGDLVTVLAEDEAAWAGSRRPWQVASGLCRLTPTLPASSRKWAVTSCGPAAAPSPVRPGSRHWRCDRRTQSYAPIWRSSSRGGYGDGRSGTGSTPRRWSPRPAAGLAPGSLPPCCST